MRILLTGASGFIGKRLAGRLVERGDRVLGTTHEPSLESPDLELVQVDFSRPDDLGSLVDRFEPDVVVHLAGKSHAGESWKAPGEYFEINVLGTEKVLAAFPKARLVLASSAEVYGHVPANEQPLEESRVPRPENPYALTKAAAERLVLRSGGLALRFFPFIGAGQSRQFALPDFAAQLAACRGRQRPTLKVGNLQSRRAFLHVDDGIDGILAAVDHGKPEWIYNVGGEKAVSVRQMLDLLIAESGLDVHVEVDEARVRAVDIPMLSANVGRLRRLGWRPRRTLNEAIAQIWEEAVSGSAAGAA